MNYKCVYCARSSSGGRWPFSKFLNVSHSPSTAGRVFIGCKVAKRHWPNIIWFPRLLFSSVWSGLHVHTLLFFVSPPSPHFIFLHFILDFRKGKDRNEINQNINSITFSTPIFHKKWNKKMQKKSIHIYKYIYIKVNL